MAATRYLVRDTDEAVGFYVDGRNDRLRGPGGTQVVIEDPSGNPIELFTSRA